MYIEPNSVIKVLKNVPLNNTYKHTIRFHTITDQYNYFAAKMKYNFTRETYQRYGINLSRLGRSADDMYDCNYMMFQNTSFGNKWFYAFIKSVKYINNGMSEIEYELDVMQTWMFEYQLQTSLIERQHSTTDVPGDNLVTEPVDLGPIVTDLILETGKFSQYDAVIAKARETV